ncbi:MAG: Mrp/NBP35 family ATP-binding protein [Phycisphaerales bacterium]|nr:Mrp/NBP35 family ATP-binding protein [Phycisphaerales bacterium]
MTLTKDAVRDSLRAIQAPGLTGDLVSSGALQWVATCDSTASVKLSLPTSQQPMWASVASQIAAAVGRAGRQAGQPVTSVIVEFVDDAGTVLHTARPAMPEGTSGATPAAAPASAAAAPTPQAQARGLPGVRHIIAVGAGKGGVGKSTIAVNLAVALARQGNLVGLMDGDIYGPSLPTLLGLESLDVIAHGSMLQPFMVHGIKSMTIGKLVDPQKPLIWRGPMAHGAFKQLAEQTNWGELDYLVIDLPPGTGDIPLTMAQVLQLSGAVIVCTPQKVAQDDAVRAARMFQQLGVAVLGVVENMSFFVCEHGTEYDIFGRGGAEHMAQRLGVPFLGSVPITPALRLNSDRGDPTANFQPGTPLAGALEAVARNVLSQLTLDAMARGDIRPTISFS